MTNPCKGKKCISYPICISKNKIECHKLSKHIKEFTKLEFGIEDSLAATHSRVSTWKYLNTFLPKLRVVKRYINYYQDNPEINVMLVRDTSDYDNV